MAKGYTAAIMQPKPEQDLFSPGSCPGNSGRTRVSVETLPCYGKEN